MTTRLSRRPGPIILATILLLAIAIAVVVAIRKPPLEVEVGYITKGPLTVTIDDEGETRVHDLFAVSAPISGRVERIELEPGDMVVAGKTVVARMAAADSEFLDPRNRAVAVSDAARLESEVRASARRVDQARAAAELAQRELARLKPLAAKGFVSRSTLDRASASEAEARANARAAQESLASAQSARNAARSVIADPSSLRSPGVLLVRSPASGRVMRRVTESERIVPAGTTLVEIGNAAQLEIVSDLLSSDAVKVTEGDRVWIEEWGGDGVLRGRVRRVEPFGFLKLSALGVEEQRVNVIIDLIDPPERWARLGHGYRVLVRIAEWENNQALRVPISALVRDRGRWAVFVVRDGRAQLVQVDLIAMNDAYAALKGGLEPGTPVILYPSDKLASGLRVSKRTST